MSPVKQQTAPKQNPPRGAHKSDMPGSPPSTFSGIGGGLNGAVEERGDRGLDENGDRSPGSKLQHSSTVSPYPKPGT
jgi:hypothetical protein